jgi:hypothetical protein
MKLIQTNQTHPVRFHRCEQLCLDCRQTLCCQNILCKGAGEGLELLLGQTVWPVEGLQIKANLYQRSSRGEEDYGVF